MPMKEEEITKAIALLSEADFREVPREVLKAFVDKAKGVLDELVSLTVEDRVLVKNLNAGSSTPHLDCGEDSCLFVKTCAQHSSAGDFRSEGGMTPDLAWVNNQWYCSKKETDRDIGAILKKGNRFLVLSDYLWEV